MIMIMNYVKHVHVYHFRGHYPLMSENRKRSKITQSQEQKLKFMATETANSNTINKT